MSRVFGDRRQAGELLAEELRRHPYSAPVVWGLARGGVVVAAPVARALDAPLEVLVAHKVGAPGFPEFGIGAVAPGGIAYRDEKTLASLHLTQEQFEELAKPVRREIDRRLDAYRRGRPVPWLEGRTAVIVDDGLATGVTAIAACRFVRTIHPDRIVLAVPVASSEAVKRLTDEVDAIVVLVVQNDFHAVGQWYRSFDQTSDEEVMRLLHGESP